MDKSKWEYKRLGEVCTVVSGSTPKTQVEEFWNGDHYWITPAELDGSTYVSKSDRLITDAAIKKTNLTLLPIGTVLLSSRAPIGKVAITTVPMYCNQGFKNLICSDAIYNKYLYWYLKINTELLNSLGRGATFKEISKTIVENIKIPVYSLDDQQRIVAELDCLNEMIALKQEQLKEFDKLAQSIFYDMFGDPITNEKGWDKSTYGKEFVIGSGGTPSKTVSEYWENGDIPWIGSNMCQNCDIYDNDGKYITKKGLENSSAKVLKDGTVLIALVGATIGKVGLLHKEMATNQNVVYINVWASGLYNPTFVFYHSMKLYQLFLNLGNGGFKMANQGFIKELPIVCPPLALQQQFAEKIQAIEEQKELVKKSIAETQQLLDSRMDFYFD